MPEHPNPPASATLELVGERRTRVDAGDLADLPFRRRTVELVCATGRRDAATWGGVPVPDLLAVGDAPQATTHLVIGTPEGYNACVGVEAALDGLLAWSKDGRPLVETEPYATRFVSPGVDGARFVKGVSRIEAVALSADEDPADYESIDTESPDVGAGSGEVEAASAEKDAESPEVER